MKSKLHYYLLAFIFVLSFNPLQSQNVQIFGPTTIGCSGIGTTVTYNSYFELTCNGALSLATVRITSPGGGSIVSQLNRDNTNQASFPVTFPSIGTYTICITANQICGRYDVETITECITVRVGLPRPFNYPRSICGGEKHGGPFPSTGSYGRTTICAPGPITDIRRLFPTPNSLPITNASGSSCFSINTSTYCNDNIRLEVSYTVCGIVYTETIRIRVECCLGDGDHRVRENVNVDSRSAEISDNSDIILKPNPAIDYIELENINSYNNYSIYTFAGTIVKEGVIHTDDLQIRTIDLESGMYLLVLSSDEEIKTLKFVKR